MENSLIQAVINALPNPIFLVESGFRVSGINLAARRMFGSEPDFLLRRPCGEVLHCFHQKEPTRICGETDYCKNCVIRNSVNKALEGDVTYRENYKMRIDKDGETKTIYLLVTTTPLKFEENSVVMLVLEDISEVIELRKILPICTKCRKVRNDQNYWQDVEAYLEKNMNMMFSHGLCPECAKKLYPDLNF